MKKYKSTTVCAIIHNGQLAIGADGQATMGNTVAKSNVKKIRKLQEGKILAGFAGSWGEKNPIYRGSGFARSSCRRRLAGSGFEQNQTS